MVKKREMINEHLKTLQSIYCEKYKFVLKKKYVTCLSFSYKCYA